MYYDKLDEYLNVPQTLRQGRLPVENGPHTIEFRNVSFRYPGAKVWALRNVSLTLREGERLSLVGENGSGKTTLIKLLCRLYDPTEGEIRMDGVDIMRLVCREIPCILSRNVERYQTCGTWWAAAL